MIIAFGFYFYDTLRPLFSPIPYEFLSIIQILYSFHNFNIKVIKSAMKRENTDANTTTEMNAKRYILL